MPAPPQWRSTVAAAAVAADSPEGMRSARSGGAGLGVEAALNTPRVASHDHTNELGRSVSIDGERRIHSDAEGRGDRSRASGAFGLPGVDPPSPTSSSSSPRYTFPLHLVPLPYNASPDVLAMHAAYEAAVARLRDDYEADAADAGERGGGCACVYTCIFGV